MRQTKIPMLTSTIALLLNIGFNYLAIFVFDLGLLGVAWGTLIARIVEVIVQEIQIRYNKIPIRINLKNYFAFNLGIVKDFFHITIFVFLNEVLWTVGVMSHSIAYGIIRTNYQITIQIAMSIIMLFTVFGNSIALVTRVVIANTLGAGENDLSIRYSHKCMIVGGAASMIMGGLMILFSNYIVRIYNLEPDVARYVANMLRVAGGFLTIRTINFIAISGILQSGSEGKWCFKVEAGTMYLIGVPLAFISAYMGMPIYIIYLLISVEEIVKMIFVIRKIFSNSWANTIV